MCHNNILLPSNREPRHSPDHGFTRLRSRTSSSSYMPSATSTRQRSITKRSSHAQVRRQTTGLQAQLGCTECVLPCTHSPKAPKVLFVTSGVASLCQQQVHRAPARRLRCLDQTRPRVIGVICPIGWTNSTRIWTILPHRPTIWVSSSPALGKEPCGSQRGVVLCFVVKYVTSSSNQPRIVVWSTQTFCVASWVQSCHVCPLFH